MTCTVVVAWENSRHLGMLPLVSLPKTSEKRAQKFHTDDASLPRSGWCFLIGRARRVGNLNSTNHRTFVHSINLTWAKRGERGISPEAREEGRIETPKCRVRLPWLMKSLLCKLTWDQGWWRGVGFFNHWKIQGALLLRPSNFIISFFYSLQL